MKKTKNIILKEGFRSVLSDGIKAFAVENLASSLTMSKKTIYQYFPNPNTYVLISLAYYQQNFDSLFNILSLIPFLIMLYSPDT